MVRLELRPAHMRGTSPCGLSPATSHQDKSYRMNWPFLFRNLVEGIKVWSLRLVPRIQLTSLNFWDKSLRLVSRNASSELFVGEVPATGPFMLTLQGTSLRD